MTVHTIRLVDQGIERPSVRSYRVAPAGEARCEHEVVKDGLIRQCRMAPAMVVDGQRLCTRHARFVRGWGR